MCLYGADTPCHRVCSPSTMPYHSWRAALGSTLSLCPRSARTALASSLESSDSLKHRLRISPTAGPPSTRTISAVLPPSSLTGKTCATRVVHALSDATNPLNAVPPLKATSEGCGLPGGGHRVSYPAARLQASSSWSMSTLSPFSPSSGTTLHHGADSARHTKRDVNARTRPALPLC